MGIADEDDDVEFSQNGNFFSQSCNPGSNVIPDKIAPNNNIVAYIKRDDVELRHDGEALQHNEHAVPAQQQADYCKIFNKNIYFDSN